MTSNKFLLFCFLSFAFCSFSWADSVKIEGAEIEWHKYYDNVLINTSDYVSPSIEAHPDKLVLIFKNAETAKFATSLKKSPRIKSIHSTSAEGSDARIVIELKKDVNYEMASLYGKGEVAIEIADKERPSIYTSLKQGDMLKKEEIELPPQPIKIEVLPPIKAKKAMLMEVLKNKIIVVDPGHGGEDPGAFGIGGIREKDLTLKTSIYLAKYLRESGASVALTRKTDIKNSLESIVELIREVNADIYIGVHYNSIDGRSIAGTETYYYSPQSFRLASLVHKSLVFSLRRPDRGIKRAMFYTIHHSTVPAILVEPVYITDMREGILALSPTFQKEVARSIVEGVKNYFLR